MPAHAGNTDDARNGITLLGRGLAPNKQMSLTTQGEAESGTFHIWLMKEPTHRKILALAGIAETYHNSTPQAVWSEDSRHVAVIFRSSRNQEEFRLYDIEGHRVRSIGGPRLFKEVTGRDVANRDAPYIKYYGIKWLGSSRFVLREYQSFVPSSDTDLLRLLGAYGRAANSSVEFAAEADCRLGPDHRYRIVDLKPGNPDAPLEARASSRLVRLGPAVH